MQTGRSLTHYANGTPDAFTRPTQTGPACKETPQRRKYHCQWWTWIFRPRTPTTVVFSAPLMLCHQSADLSLYWVQSRSHVSPGVGDLITKPCSLSPAWARCRHSKMFARRHFSLASAPNKNCTHPTMFRLIHVQADLLLKRSAMTKFPSPALRRRSCVRASRP